MLLIQMTGLSGAGKTTIALEAKKIIEAKGLRIEVLDGDHIRKSLFKELGYSRVDRHENIRRLGFIGNLLMTNGIITILCAINPYEEIRSELVQKYGRVRTVWVNCDLDTLMERDTKGLYARAKLPSGHPSHLSNLTGFNDPYDIPAAPDLIIHTGKEAISESVDKLVGYILGEITCTPSPGDEITPHTAR